MMGAINRTSYFLLSCQLIDAGCTGRNGSCGVDQAIEGGKNPVPRQRRMATSQMLSPNQRERPMVSTSRRARVRDSSLRIGFLFCHR